MDLDIARIKREWQGAGNAGASTLITRAGSQYDVPQRKMWTASKNSIDPKTGEKIYTETEDAHYITKDGKEKVKTTRSTKGAEWTVEQLYSSNGPTAMEKIYGDYMQECKNLGNQCRLSWLNSPKQEYNPSAAKAYADEVKSLNTKLSKALQNAPRERQAQALANADYKAITKDNPEIKQDKDEVKKLKNTLLTNARLTTGAHKDRIVPTEKEWEAIQAGAISENKLTSILNNGNKEAITSLARPRENRGLSSAQITRIKNLAQKDKYTISDIADFMGLSVGTISDVLSPFSAA